MSITPISATSIPLIYPLHVKQGHDNKISHPLSPASIQEVETLLQKQFSQETDLTIKELLELTKATKVEIVGGFVRWLLAKHPEEVQNLSDLELPQIEARYPPDYDIRCWFQNSDEHEFPLMADDLIQELNRRAGKEISFKKKPTKNLFTGDAHLHRLPFKNGNQPTLDLIMVRTLGRKYFSTIDAIRIKGGTTLVSELGLQPFVDLAHKIIRIPEPEKINAGGWPMLISYMTRGYTTPSKEAEETLLATTRQTSNLVDELQKCLENHHENDPEAKAALWLNASFSAEEVWSKRIIPEGSGLLFDLLQMDSLQEVKDLLQVAGLAARGTSGFRIVRSWGGDALQVQFGRAYLLLPFEPTEALQSFKSSTHQWILSLAKTQDKDHCTLAYHLWLRGREGFSHPFAETLIDSLAPQGSHFVPNIYHYLLERSLPMKEKDQAAAKRILRALRYLEKVNYQLSEMLRCRLLLSIPSLFQSLEPNDYRSLLQTLNNWINKR